jgi:hypothetical protein
MVDDRDVRCWLKTGVNVHDTERNEIARKMSIVRLSVKKKAENVMQHTS